MKISIPELIDEDQELLFSNLGEDPAPEYNPTTTYQAGDIVKVSTYHRLFQAIVPVTGVHPLDGVEMEIPVWWDIGSTNRWAMFDGQAGTVTESDYVIVTIIRPDTPVDNVALFGMEAEKVLCEVYTPGTDTPVYSETRNLVLEKFNPFDPEEYLGDLVFENLPASQNMKIHLRITPVSGQKARCALVVPGRVRDLGCTQYGMGLGILDHSRVDRDDFGRTFIVRRHFSKTVKATVSMKNTHVDRVHRTLSQHRATAIVWMFTEKFSASLVYGFFRDFDIVVENFDHSLCGIEVEGLV